MVIGLPGDSLIVVDLQCIDYWEWRYAYIDNYRNRLVYNPDSFGVEMQSLFFFSNGEEERNEGMKISHSSEIFY